MNSQLFNGFTPSTFQFLGDLRCNNNKLWYEENKPVYQDCVVKPMQQLALDLGPALVSIDPLLEPLPAPNRAISRIYRDTRFSKDKSPYKSNLWLTFKRQSKDWKEAPCFFFEIFPDSYRYGMGFYTATRQTMDNMRDYIREKPEEFRQLVAPVLEAGELSVEGDRYKRILDSTITPDLSPWYQLKNIFICNTRPLESRLFSGDLTQHIMSDFRLLGGLYEFLWKMRS